MGNKKKRGIRGAFISHPYLVFSSHVHDVMLFPEFSALGTAHSMTCCMIFFSNSTAPLMAVNRKHLL